jgi:hypothetical protein
VSSFDAYEEDMGRFHDLSEANIDRIMAGRIPLEDSEDLKELSLGLAALKAVGSWGTDQVLERHLNKIAEASRVVARKPAPEAKAPRGATTGWRRALRITRSFVAKLGVAGAALALSTAGLAVAGVDLPGTTAEDTFEKVGIELPNQDGDESHGKSAADRVHAAQDAATEKGCEFGQAVSAAASENNNGKSTKENDPCKDRDEEEVIDDGPGKAGEDHGKAGDDHGKAGEKGQGGTKGKAGGDHGQAGDDHGKAGEDHGKPDEEEETG